MTLSKPEVSQFVQMEPPTPGAKPQPQAEFSISSMQDGYCVIEGVFNDLESIRGKVFLLLGGKISSEQMYLKPDIHGKFTFVAVTSEKETPTWYLRVRPPVPGKEKGW